MTSATSFIRRRLRHAGAVAAFAAACTAVSGPGAHGPDGEHPDGPANAVAGAQHPRVEAHSELFELVAQLKGGELSILIDRYDSNEPVLGAGLEVESGALKAVAAFRAESGAYVVTDAALLKALAAPGEHPLVFTLVAGKESDLLDATLVTGGAGTRTNGHAHHDDHDHDHDHPHGFSWKRIAAAGVVALGLGLMATTWWRRRRRGNVVAARGNQS